jgi:hypothetical protein
MEQHDGRFERAGRRMRDGRWPLARSDFAATRLTISQFIRPGR